MQDYEIAFVDALSLAEEEKMIKDLAAYESKHGVYANYKKYTLVLKDKKGSVFGALIAFTEFAEVYIDFIWVETSHRGQGFGKVLLETLEAQFAGKGFHNINLVTSAFQAPEFYKKCGFEQEFVRENKQHPQLTKIFFVKYFKEKIQTQGIK